MKAFVRSGPHYTWMECSATEPVVNVLGNWRMRMDFMHAARDVVQACFPQLERLTGRGRDKGREREREKEKEREREMERPDQTTRVCMCVCEVCT